MKRKVAATLVAVLVFGAGMQAVAAPSINGGTVDLGQVTVEDGTTGGSGEESGWRVLLDEINKEDYPEEVQNLIERVAEVKPEDTVADVYREFIDLSNLKVFDIESIHLEEEDGESLLEKMYFLSDIEQIIFDGIEPTEEKPLSVTFTVNNMTDNMDVYILNWCEKDGWELLETERMADNRVRAKFHANASLVAFVYMEKEELPEEAVGTSPSIHDAQPKVATDAETEKAD